MNIILYGLITLGLFYSVVLVPSGSTSVSSLGGTNSTDVSRLEVVSRDTQPTPDMPILFRPKSAIGATQTESATSPSEITHPLTPDVKPVSFVQKIKNSVRFSTVNVEPVVVACDEDGYPTITALEKLVDAIDFNVIDRDKNCTIERVGAEDSPRIYSVRFENNPISFFLKIHEDGNVIDKLAYVQRAFIEKISEQSKEQYGYPIITKIEMIFTYTYSKKAKGNKIINGERFIEVVQAAQGESIVDFFDNGKNFPSNIEAEKNCLYAVGEALGLFQQTFVKYNSSDKPEEWLTVGHNDLNVTNVFYDQNNSQVYFIDNETMSDRCRISNDFTTFIFDNLFLNKCVNHNKDNYKIYLDLYLEFIKGYLTSFPQDKIIPLGSYVKKISMGKFNEQAHVILDDATYHYNYVHDILDFNIIKIMLSIHPDAVKKEFELTPLHLAVAEKSIEEINKILTHDRLTTATMINKEDTEGHSPLFWALAQGDADIVRLLCKKGASFDEPVDTLGNTLLHSAVGISNIEMISVLLAEGADVNARNNNGETPLRIAVDNQNESVVQLLQQVRGIDLDSNNKEEKKVLAKKSASNNSAF